MVPTEYYSPTQVNRFTFLSSSSMEFVRGSNAIIHSALSTEIDFDHKKALNIVLQDCTDEQIVAEFAQRIADRKHLKRVQKVNEKYHFERLLAKGTSSKVHLVYHKETGVGYACKIMEWSTKEELNLIDAQIDAMKTANHEFVISLFEYFKSSKCIWLIMELTNSVPLRGMLKRLDADRNQSESFVNRSITQILQGVEYLHSMGIVHRGLKIDNIFYQGDISTGKIKISSFGLSTIVKSETKDSALKTFAGLKERWGTVTHASPELIFNPGYGSQTDIWSVGCLLYEMITTLQAFPLSSNDLKHNNVDLYRKIKGCKYDRSKLKGSSLQSLVSNLLQVDPLKRHTATQALNDLCLDTPIQNKHPIQTIVSFKQSCTKLPESSQVTIKISRGTKIPLGTKFPLRKSYFKSERISNDKNSIFDNSINIQDISLDSNPLNAFGIKDSLKTQSQYDSNNLEVQNDIKQIKFNKRRNGFFNSIFRFRKEKL